MTRAITRVGAGEDAAAWTTEPWARQAASLSALAELAMNTEDVASLVQAACATAVEILGVDAAALLEHEGDALVIRAGIGLDPADVGQRLPRGDGGGEILLGSTVAGGSGAPLRPLFAGHGFEVSVEVGLPGRDRPFGLLGVYGRSARTFTPEDLRFLETAASVLASALARSRAEAEVLDRERQMRAVFDNALEAMLIVDDAGRLRDLNPAAASLLGAPRVELLGRRIRELAPPGLGRPASARGLSALGAAGERTDGETEVALPGRRPRSVEFSAIPSILPGRHLALMRDITEQKQLHARLALADRMVSVGTLAAGVAHELNNPLAYVNANLTFLTEQLALVSDLLARVPGLAPAEADLGAQLQDAVRDARDGTERMRIIIRDLKTFSRVDEDRTGAVDLRKVIESCVNMAWNEIRHRARLVKDFSPVPPVRGNEARLGQVFLNLLVNAAQACPEGKAEESEIRISARPLDDGRVAVEVRDTGCGIAPEHLHRVFDPFFTTKAPGVGTGLGLAICHSIVTGLGGDITVESALQRGTVFRVTLAAVAAPAPALVAPPPSPPVRPRGRILVVDDEPLVGTVIQRTLQAEHDITVVSSARAALDRLGRGECFDLVLSDLLMPEMSGMDLYRELSARDARLARRMVFLTGGAFTPAAREFLERESVLCIEKPFELDTIRVALARKLAEPAA